MSFATQNPDTITAAESTRHSWELEQMREARAHDIAVRKLELEVLKKQTTWGVLLSLPITLIKLPVYLLLGIGYIACAIRKHDPGERFWNLLSK